MKILFAALFLAAASVSIISVPVDAIAADGNPWVD